MIDKLTAPEFTKLFSIFTATIVTLSEKVVTAYALCRELTDEEASEIIAEAKKAADQITSGYIAALEKRGEEISTDDAEQFREQIAEAALTETRELINRAEAEIVENSRIIAEAARQKKSLYYS